MIHVLQEINEIRNYHMSVSEDQLTTWAKPPSETEEEKCRNAVSRITDAIKAKFGSDVSIFLQGSYKNRTNVKKDSDVDIVIRHDSYYFYDLGNLSPEEKKEYKANSTPADYTFSQFKNDVQTVLAEEFGQTEVERKNKCIRVKGSLYRVNADVVPCYEYRRYVSPTRIEAVGVGLLPDSGWRIHSFPQQHYDNGAKKNKDTNGAYKDIVRIVKNARNTMIDNRIITLDAMPSFLIESFVWNIHELHFEHPTYVKMTSTVVSKIWQDMNDFEKHNNYAEVSDLKWLFRGDKKWTPQVVKAFMENAWSFFGF